MCPCPSEACSSRGQMGRETVGRRKLRNRPPGARWRREVGFLNTMFWFSRLKLYNISNPIHSFLNSVNCSWLFKWETNIVAWAEP